jgi:hypothetical protein
MNASVYVMATSLLMPSTHCVVEKLRGNDGILLKDRFPGLKVARGEQALSLGGGDVLDLNSLRKLAIVLS